MDKFTNRQSYRGLVRPDGRKMKLLITLGIVGGILAVFILIAAMVDYAGRPQIEYTVKKADCSSGAIAERNRTSGGKLESCVLIISAKNLKNQPAHIDYDGAGGGPMGNRKPLIRINATDGKFCYAGTAGEGSSFEPKATNDITLRCAYVSDEPKNYDMKSDTKPESIEIAGYSGATLPVKPAR